MYTVIILHIDNSIEADKTFSSYEEAISCEKFYKDYGSLVAVLPAKMAAKLHK